MIHSLSQNSSGELGDVGDGGRLRCLQGKVDTTILCVYIHVLLAPPSVLGAWSMALVLDYHSSNSKSYAVL